MPYIMFLRELSLIESIRDFVFPEQAVLNHIQNQDVERAWQLLGNAAETAIQTSNGYGRSAVSVPSLHKRRGPWHVKESNQGNY